MLSFHKVKHCWLLCLYICIYLHNNITNKQMQISWVGRPRNCSKKYEVLHPYQVISIGHFEQQFFELILVSDPLETKSNQMEPRSPRYCYPRGICISCDTIFHMKPPQKDKKRCVKGWEGSRSQRGSSLPKKRNIQNNKTVGQGMKPMGTDTKTQNVWCNREGWVLHCYRSLDNNCLAFDRLRHRCRFFRLDLRSSLYIIEEAISLLKK